MSNLSISATGAISGSLFNDAPKVNVTELFVPHSKKMRPTGRLQKPSPIINTPTLKQRRHELKIAPGANLQPDSLELLLSKLKLESRGNDDPNKRRHVNERLANSLFMANIDAEEVEASMMDSEHSQTSIIHTNTDTSNITKSASNSGVNSSTTAAETVESENARKGQMQQKGDTMVFQSSMVIKGGNNKEVGAPRSKIAAELSLLAPREGIPDKVKRKVDNLIDLSNDHRHKGAVVHGVTHLEGISGNLIPITKEHAERYFGEQARVSFFEQYRNMCRNVEVLAPCGVSNSYTKPGSAGSVSSNTNDDHSVNSNTTKSIANAGLLPVGASSVVQSLSSEFFSDLQSISSNQLFKNKVDQKLLLVNIDGKNKRSKQAYLEKLALSSSVTTKPKMSIEGKRNKKKRMKNKKMNKNRIILTPLDIHLAKINGSSSMSLNNDSITDFGSCFSTLNSTSITIKKAHDSLGQVEHDWDILTTSVPASPRTRYLSGCIKSGIQPIPNLVLRRDYVTQLNLSHYSMGDKMGCILAEAIEDLPCIESINLNDNDLTDDSLQYLIESVIHITTLKELNLSRNKIDGHSSDALAEFVARPDCPLVKLVLQNADVDDGECDAFVQTLKTNKQLLELDLSSNLLGSAESDETARTGGQAIAEYIQSECCRLQTLRLAWNAIRMKSAVSLTKALAFNHTLTYLDLDNNGIGFAAGEVLGDSLMENRTLKTLLLNSNGLTATATISILAGLVENLALTRLEMNENPIGIPAAKMIMQVSAQLGSRVQLQVANCNTMAHDERCWYDPTKPCRDYKLELWKPFDRAVCFNLMQIVAGHSTYIITNPEYEAEPNRGTQKLRFKEGFANDRELFFDEDQKRLIAGLRLLYSAASNKELGTELFYEADADNSGLLDKEELEIVLTKIGFVIDAEKLSDILAVFNVDGEGTIDLHEFLSLLKSQQREASMRIKEMTQYPIITLNGKRYIPPRAGTLYFTVTDGYVLKESFQSISSIDHQYAYNMAKGIGDLSLMTEAVRHIKLHFDEAYLLYKVLYKEMRDTSAVLLKVLPLMMNSTDARHLLAKATHDNIIELNRVKIHFGITLRPLLGAFNGYYCLDLSKEIHRICLSRLLEQSQTLNNKRYVRSVIAPGKVGDVSQHGNWSSFRNEVYNGERIVVTPKKFTPMPHSGILEFDFSGGGRPEGGELVINDRRICKVLTNLCLMTADRQSEAMGVLSNWREKASQMNNAKNLFMPIYAFDQKKALEAGLASDDFYNNLINRKEIVKHGHRKAAYASGRGRQEPVEGEAGSVAGSQGQPASADENSSSSQQIAPSQNNPDEDSVGGDTANEGMEDLEEDEDKFDVGEPGDDWEDEEEGEEEEEEDNTSATPLPRLKPAIGKALSMVTSAFHDNLVKATSPEEDPAPIQDDDNSSQNSSVVPTNKELYNKQQQKIMELKERLQKLLEASRGYTKKAKAQRFVEAIDETFQLLWILSRHLALIVKLFQDIFGVLNKCPYFGSFSVDIVVALFPRVYDLHNFEVVLEVLDSKDCAALFARIGVLNIFNPMKPEVTYELDLDRREERILAKMIVYLSVVEPGINLTWKQFQWKREIDIIPGWDVTEPWMTESGMSAHGKFAFTYYSGEGKNKFGCYPDIRLRKALTHLTLINENEIVDEDSALPDEYVVTAIRHSEENRDIWVNYLSNNKPETF